MDKDQDRIIQLQKEQHAEHNNSRRIWCTLCYPLKSSTEKFKSFWNYMKIHYNATMCNGATQNFFEELSEGDEVAKVNRIKNIIETMVFEKHEEIQDNRVNLSSILSKEFKKKNYFKSLSREGSKNPSRELSREGSKDRNGEELNLEKTQSKEINEEKINKNSNIIVNLNSSRGRSPNRGTSR